MSGSVDYTPRPTEFDGVRFRSKSEAQFGALLHKSGAIDFIYEPDWTAGDKWVADFAIPMATKHRDFHWILIEYKPKEPTETYLNELTQRFNNARLKSNFPCECFVCWLDFYDPIRNPAGACRLDADEIIRFGHLQHAPVLGRTHWYMPECVEKIRQMRFDLQA